MRISRGKIHIHYVIFIISMSATALTVHFLAAQLLNHPIKKNVIFSQQSCVDEDFKNCIPPFKKFDNKYRTAEKFKLGACVIEKSMSTLLAAMMCLLHDEISFREANRSLTTDMWENRFCKEKNEFNSMESLLLKTNSKMGDFKFFTVVRDPVERFLSGFVDKCVLEKKRNMNPDKCYGCKRNFTCFLQEQHKRAKIIANGRRLAWGYEDVHFLPQNWHCEMHTYFHYYKFVKYRTKTNYDYTKMLDDITDVLTSVNVPNSTIKSIMDEFLGLRSTKHATFRVPERSYYEMKLKADKSAMEILVKLYYFDFVLFGFPIPNF